MFDRKLSLSVICLILFLIMCGCTSPIKTSSVSQTVPSTPKPAPIVGTWEGPILFDPFLNETIRYRVTFYTGHVFYAEPLTSRGHALTDPYAFGGSWYQCVIDVCCPITGGMGEPIEIKECQQTERVDTNVEEYTPNDYLLKYGMHLMMIFKQVSLKNNTLISGNEWEILHRV